MLDQLKVPTPANLEFLSPGGSLRKDLHKLTNDLDVLDMCHQAKKTKARSVCVYVVEAFTPFDILDKKGKSVPLSQFSETYTHGYEFVDLDQQPSTGVNEPRRRDEEIDEDNANDSDPDLDFPDDSDDDDEDNTDHGLDNEDFHDYGSPNSEPTLGDPDYEDYVEDLFRRYYDQGLSSDSEYIPEEDSRRRHQS